MFHSEELLQRRNPEKRQIICVKGVHTLSSRHRGVNCLVSDVMLEINLLLTRRKPSHVFLTPLNNTFISSVQLFGGHCPSVRPSRRLSHQTFLKMLRVLFFTISVFLISHVLAFSTSLLSDAARSLCSALISTCVAFGPGSFCVSTSAVR